MKKLILLSILLIVGLFAQDSPSVANTSDKNDILYLKDGTSLECVDTLFVERGIKNGEEFKLGPVSRIFNRILNIFLPILNKTLFLPYPNDDDGIFHHLLVSAQKNKQ